MKKMETEQIVMKDEDELVLAEELKVLNEIFLSNVQDALVQTPDACLAPLVLDYLKYVYPLVLQKKKENNPGEEEEDLSEIVKFFSNVKKNFKTEDTIDDKSSVKKTNGVHSVKSSSTAMETENSKVSTTPGPGFFGLPVAGGRDAKPASSSAASSSSSFFSFSGTAAKATVGGSSSSSVNSVAPTITSSAAPVVSTGFKFGDSKTVNNNAFGSTSSSSASLFGKPGVETTGTSTSGTSSTGLSSKASPGGGLFGSSFGATPAATTSTTVAAPTIGSLASKPSTSLFGGFQPTATSTPGGFSFGLPSAAAGSGGFGSGGFQFTPAPTSTAAKGPNVNGTEENKDESDDENPPKPDHVPVVEDDAVYTQRIKLFEMEGKKFKDLGVGNLFVKPLSSGKNQLLIRADNSLGTILVNALLNASTPIRQNKPTNILITLPSADGKPITYLMRVKDATLGNELTQALEKYKSQQQS